MPFEKISAGKLSQAVTHQIEELILRGILRPGERFGFGDNSRNAIPVHYWRTPACRT